MSSMQNRRSAAFLLLAIVTFVPVAYAQSDPGIEPDRPDVTNGTHVVPPGLVQIEFGGMYTRDAPGQTGGTSPFTFRIGIANWIEGRIGADGVTTQNGPDSRATGFGNMQIGAKLRLWAD